MTRHRGVRAATVRWSADGAAKIGHRMEGTTVMPTRLTGLRRHIPSFAVMSKFILTGGLVAAVQLGLVTLLVLLRVPIQLSLAMAYVVVLTLHFTLNRQWVFAGEAGYAFHLSGQGARYLVLAGTSYAGTATGIALFPALLGIPELAAFFLSSALMACVSFMALHLWIFRAAPPPTRGSAE